MKFNAFNTFYEYVKWIHSMNWFHEYIPLIHSMNTFHVYIPEYIPCIHSWIHSLIALHEKIQLIYSMNTFHAYIPWIHSMNTFHEYIHEFHDLLWEMSYCIWRHVGALSVTKIRPTTVRRNSVIELLATHGPATTRHIETKRGRGKTNIHGWTTPLTKCHSH